MKKRFLTLLGFLIGVGLVFAVSVGAQMSIPPVWYPSDSFLYVRPIDNDAGAIMNVGSYTEPIPNGYFTNIYATSTTMDTLTVDNLEVNIVATSTKILVGNGTAGVPSYSFANDTDTGIYLGSSDIINITNGGAVKWQFASTWMGSATASGAALMQSSASNIIPTLLPASGDTNTGIGWNAADELSLIAGGTEGLRIDYNELEVQPLMTLATGPIEFEEDSGAITALNMPVSSAPSDGDEMSMSFSIDSNLVLKVYGEADGVGGADTFRLGVATSSPAYTLDVYGDFRATTLYGDGSNLTGISSSYARTATKVVCASDALDTTNCDYVCDGTADQVQINLAIVATDGVNGGEVYLSEGTFNLTGNIQIYPYVHLVGSGWNTILKYVSGGNSIFCIDGSATGYTDGWAVKNLQVDGDSVSGAGGSFTENETELGSWEVSNVWIHDMNGGNTFNWDYEESGASGGNIIVKNNRFESNAGDLFLGQFNVGADDGGLIVDGNYFGNATGDININQADGCIITNNVWANSDGGIKFNGSNVDNCLVANNYVDTTGIAFYSLGGGHLVKNNYFNAGTWSIYLNQTGAIGNIFTGNTIIDIIEDNNNNSGSNVYTNNVIDRSKNHDIADDSEWYNNIGSNPKLERRLSTMKNVSGVAFTAGDIVTLALTAVGDECTTTLTADESLVYGMAIETINNAAYGKIQIGGKTTLLKVDGTDDIAIGDCICSFTTAGIGAKCSNDAYAIAIALEAYTTNDSAGVIDALIINRW